MKKIRKGNDIAVKWSIFQKVTSGGETKEEPYDLSGRDLFVELRIGAKSISITGFSVSENVLSFTYPGRIQDRTGSVTLTLIENKGKPQMRTLDKVEAFALVAHSVDAGGESSCSHIAIEEVELSSSIESGPRGYSAYEIAVQNGFVGTEEEWLESLKGEDGEPGPQGPAGRDGSDAEVTKENIENALGYTPVQPSDIAGFITRSVNDLANYYLKSETYTKDEVAALIGAIQQFHYEVYPALPATGESNVLYLIGPTGSGADRYEEYVYASGSFVKIGDTSIDLSQYPTREELQVSIDAIDRIFIAEYGVTTFEECLQEYNKNKAIYCFYGNHIYRAVNYVGSGYIFFVAFNYDNGLLWISCTSGTSNNWQTLPSVPLETQRNKTTSLSSASTDQQYPSAKTVYEYVTDKLGDIETLLAAI